MAKITNITPEEREQAILTIGKLGEEITDERIEYYVKLRRNTIKHQEEKLSKAEVGNASVALNETVQKKYMKISKIMAVVSVVAVVLSFIVSGFSFSIGWYLIIFLLLVFAFVFYIEGNDSSQKVLNDGDSLIIKTATVVSLCCVVVLWIWGPLNPNYSYSSNGSSDNPYNMPKEYHTEPCEECGEVGTYYIAEDGTQTGDRRYALHGHWYCISCYKIKKEFSDALGF